jgi:ubiquinone/menaquinone biosynthesis C-methylase UbiE
VVLDVGGGSGVYTRWLAALGYEAHLIDPVALHLQQARVVKKPALASISQGTAQSLRWPDGKADAVLLAGPLYHLTERKRRVKALREARRVVRKGGCVFAVGISKFSPVFSGLSRKLLDDAAAMELVSGVLRDGQHRNPSGHPEYFTTAFFHHPDGLREELEMSGLRVEGVFGLEGAAWLLADLDHYWGDAGRREQLLGFLRALEAEPSLLGLSAHLLAVGRRIK